MSLKDVVGQDPIARLLVSSIKSSRLAGAYLLTGEEGTGKRYLAYQFAKALNCAQAAGDSCDRCLPCRKIDHGNHPDVREISDEGPSIKIDSIRKLRDEINLKPFEGRWKVFIIPDAERLTLSAANCLLKTLEEPPERSLLLLTAANPSRIMPTVRSRCQTLHFRPLDVDVVEKALVGRWGLPPEEARSRAIASGGRMGEAIKTDQGHILRDGVVELIKSTDFRDKTFRFADELSGTKEECLRHLDLLLSCYRDMLIIEPGRGAAFEGGSPRNIVNVDIGADLAKEASRLGQPAILKALSIVEETKKQINSNANVRLSLEVMLDKLSVVGYQQ